MNQFRRQSSDNYEYRGSTLARDSRMFTNSAVPGELSKLIEDTVVIFDFEHDKFFTPSSEFKFHPFNLKPPSSTVINLTTLPSPRYSLTKQLSIMMSREEEEIKAEIPELELYAFAENEDDSVQEVVKDFLDLCDDLLDIPDKQLGRYPKKWKEFIESIVTVNA